MAEVLGRVVPGDLERPRGPDANHRVRVPRTWLERGAVVELELPRNLVCAVCDGGGCDACERSGAVTLRGRGEPADLLQVTLPGAHAEPFVIRLPERGGLPPLGSGLPRGHLLLRVEPSAQADANVSLAASVPALGAIRRALSERPVLVRRAGVVLWVLAIGVILLSVWLLLRR
jgi:hypothetical protein